MYFQTNNLTWALNSLLWNYTQRDYHQYLVVAKKPELKIENPAQ